MKEQGLFRTGSTVDPEFTDTLELDLSSVEPSLAGPKRPQDRVALASMKNAFQNALRAPKSERGFELSSDALERKALVGTNGSQAEIKKISSITGIKSVGGMKYIIDKFLKKIK